MVDFTETFKKTICCLIRNPKREITYAWLVSLVFVLVAFIVACVSASRMKQTSTDQVTAFSAVWTSILLLLISLVGTIIMRRYQTSLSIGFLLGVIFIMTQQMLIVFAFFAEQAKDPTNTTDVTMAQQAMAVFSFFIFIVYAGFGTMLAVFRNDIIKEEIPSSDPAGDYDIHNGPAEEGDENQI
jgi:lysylphosphatidylglycerol synthetase-like protein (DUF2156 family)